MVQKRFTGLLAAAVTPLARRRFGQLAQVRPLVDHLVRNQVNGLFVCGSTGEGPLLTSDERRATAAAFVDAAAGRLPVIVHVGHCSPAEARLLAEHAQGIGADAVAAVPPWYFKPESIDQLIGCLAEIAAGDRSCPSTITTFPAARAYRSTWSSCSGGGRSKFPPSAAQNTRPPPSANSRPWWPTRGDDSTSCTAATTCCWPGWRPAPGGGRHDLQLCGPAVSAIARGFPGRRHGGRAEFQTQAISMCRILLRYGAIPASKAIMKFLGVDCGPLRLPLVQLAPAEEQSLKAESGSAGILRVDPAGIVSRKKPATGPRLPAGRDRPCRSPARPRHRPPVAAIRGNCSAESRAWLPTGRRT